MEGGFFLSFRGLTLVLTEVYPSSCYWIGDWQLRGAAEAGVYLNECGQRRKKVWDRGDSHDNSNRKYAEGL